VRSIRGAWESRAVEQSATRHSNTPGVMMQ
jgi:hypothetical protein